jgi:hypothetical protein
MDTFENDGRRIGRFVCLRDVDGRRHAISATAVAAVSADDLDGSLLLLPGGRLVRVDAAVEVVVGWLNSER